MQQCSIFVSMLLGLAGGLTGAAEPAATEINIPVCATPPKLDADLSDPAWKAAARLTGFHLLDSGQVADVQTTAWICRDDAWLYIAFRCLEPNAGSIRRLLTRRDDAVANDDSVEVFIDPGTEGKQWVHLALSAGNVQRDQLCQVANRYLYINWPWRSAAQPDPHIDTSQGWSAELAFPLILLQQGARPGPWRINLCRNRQAVAPPERMSLAVLPAGATFQSPQYFIPIRGLTGFKATPVFGPMLGAVKLQPLRAEQGKYFYDLQIGLSNPGPTGGVVEVVVQDVPRVGKGNQVVQSVELPPAGNTNLLLAIEVGGPALRDAWVALREPQTGLILQRSEVEGMDALTPFDAYLDRNYYTTESDARVYVEMRLDPAERAKTGLQLKTTVIQEKGPALGSGSTECTKDELSFLIPLTQIPEGRHVIQLALSGRGNQPLGAIDLPLRKLPPAPAGANEVKIDHYNRCLLVNGRPFFPMGVFGLFMHGNLDDWRLEVTEAQYGYCREAGLNFVCDWRGYAGTPESLEYCRKYYDLVYKFGLKVVGHPYAYTSSDLNYGSPKFREAATRQIQAMDPYLKMCREHPAIIGYYHFDEPGEARDFNDILEQFRDKIVSVDPYHPVYLSNSRYLHPHYQKWFGTVADLIGAHNYWYVMTPDNLRTMSGYWDALDIMARNSHTPTLAAPQIDYWGTGYEGGGFMLPDEQRAQTYLALVHGARSVMYFAMPWHHQLSIATQKAISAEVQELAPALLTREPRQQMTFEPEAAAVSFPMGNVNRRDAGDRKYPFAVPSLRVYPDGRQVLLAVNPGIRAVTARFSVSSLTPRSTVEMMFGAKQPLAVADGAFTDTLGPFATRAYRLTETQAPKGEAIRIHVAMSGPAVEAALRPEEPKPKARPGKNLAGNSSFERARMPGHPDLWHACALKALIPDPLANGLETNHPFHGKYCFRVVRPYPTDIFAYGQPVPVKPDTVYTLSGYLRADKPDMQVRLALFGQVKFVKAGADWQRYSITANSGTAAATPLIFYPWQEGTLYVDAVQLEAGPEPTEYEPN